MRFLVHEPFAIHFHQLVDLALLEARWISLDSAAAYSSCKPTIKASRGESVMMTMIGWWLLEVFLACIHFCETEGLRGSFSFSVRASEVSYRSRRRRIRFVSTSLCMQFVCRMPRESYRYYVTEEVERHKQQRGCPESERHNLLCYSSVYDYTLYLANCTVCTGKHYFVEKSRVIKQSGCPKSESHTMWLQAIVESHKAKRSCPRFLVLLCLRVYMPYRYVDNSSEVVLVQLPQPLRYGSTTS